AAPVGNASTSTNGGTKYFIYFKSGFLTTIGQKTNCPDVYTSWLFLDLWRIGFTNKFELLHIYDCNIGNMISASITEDSQHPVVAFIRNLSFVDRVEQVQKVYPNEDTNTTNGGNPGAVGDSNIADLATFASSMY
ncbi:hypothetical protein EV182_005420, partial [Spiromyces aspiralis]